ncbi:MgtC/SapB family protein [Paraburkholderia sp. SIMBA_050]|nr:methyltransferase [Burkholderia sp. A27]
MLPNLELLSRLVLAAALGSVIGFERERLSWAAGLRTHMLVCVGSAAIGLAVGGGLYTASIAATIIILIILAGIKPLERRFITVKQRRQLTMIVERGAMTFHSLHDELGAASPRVKQFVMQQSDDEPECDEVIITLHRVSNAEYEAICSRLRQLRGVKHFRQDDASS